MAGTRDARQRILDATADLVTAGGLDAATPAAIAERADAGKMSLYRHFSGKDELVAEALAERTFTTARG
jgi:AcrR family transcriptional regulator